MVKCKEKIFEKSNFMTINGNDVLGHIVMEFKHLSIELIELILLPSTIYK